MAGKFDHLLPVYTAEELEQEEWRLVRFDGRSFLHFSISNLGRIRRTNGRFLKPLWCTSSLNPSGVYWRVGINWREKGKYRVKHAFIHRIVAETFLPGKTKRKRFVHHKDHNPSNPRANNLEWVTQRKNLKEYFLYKRETEAYERMQEIENERFDLVSLPDIEYPPIYDLPF